MKTLTDDGRFAIYVEDDGNIVFADGDMNFPYCSNCGHFVRAHELEDHGERCESKNIFNTEDRRYVERKAGVKIDLAEFKRGN